MTEERVRKKKRNNEDCGTNIITSVSKGFATLHHQVNIISQAYLFGEGCDFIPDDDDTVLCTISLHTVHNPGVGEQGSPEDDSL